MNIIDNELPYVAIIPVFVQKQQIALYYSSLYVTNTLPNIKKITLYRTPSVHTHVLERLPARHMAASSSSHNTLFVLYIYIYTYAHSNTPCSLTPISASHTMCAAAESIQHPTMGVSMMCDTGPFLSRKGNRHCRWLSSRYGDVAV